MRTWARSDEREKLLVSLRAEVQESLRGKKKKKDKEDSKSKVPIHLDRKLALLKLRDISSTGLREMLWHDEEVQKILLWSVEESQPELAQVLALAIFVQLTSSARNCEALLHNEEVRASLIRRAQESGEVGEKALLALKGLTIAAFQGDYEDVRNVLGLAAGKGRMPSQRIEVFRALWSAAVVSESPELFFGNTRIWPTVCESIEPTEPAEIRENVLGLLGALTQQATGPHFVWHDEGLREHLLTSTTRSQPSTVRSRALMALAGIAREPEMRSAIWAYVSVDATRKLTEDEEEDVRHASSGRKRTRTASDVSDVDAASDHPEAKNAAEMEKPSMKDSLLAAASRIELCTVRSPALKVLLEISFEEEFMMELVDSGVAELLLDAFHDQRLQPKERKLCQHGHNRIIEWNEARIAEELRLERECEARERAAMLWEEDYQVVLREAPEMKRADEESFASEEWSKADRELKAMVKEDDWSSEVNKYLKFLLEMNRQCMELEDELSHQVRKQEEERLFASKIAAARERAAEAAIAAAGAMKRVGGDAVLQARDAGEAAGAAAAKLGMGPFIQAAFAGSQAASAASIKQKQPLSRAEQLDEASKAAMLVADRCGMTSQEKEMIAEATVAAKDAAHLDNESDIAMCFAVALASRLSLTDEARIAVTGATSVDNDNSSSACTFPGVFSIMTSWFRGAPKPQIQLTMLSFKRCGDASARCSIVWPFPLQMKELLAVALWWSTLPRK
ncbi:unnamed protein product [Symbiodinium natans]|uniref:Uncharacterized protein n=1 Tax=Symbiodinium natans TaxID=878477 RepID=A0A812N8F4_9DINO|nr:unnamed protein product [Symbiodinium natans]